MCGNKSRCPGNPRGRYKIVGCDGGKSGGDDDHDDDHDDHDDDYDSDHGHLEDGNVATEIK